MKISIKFLNRFIKRKDKTNKKLKLTKRGRNVTYGCVTEHQKLK